MLDSKIQKRKVMIRLTALIATVSLFSYLRADSKPDPARTDREVIVAVIDTGVNIGHEMLRESIWVNDGEIAGNGRDDDGNGYVDDVCGWDFYNNDASVFHDVSYVETVSGNEHEDDHGTHVAGLIVTAASEKIEQLSGSQNAKIRIMVLKVNGGAEANGKTADAVKAIEYAEKNGASICNLSWGTYENDPALKEAIKRSGMLFICCAGNDGSNNDEKPLYPACYTCDNILAVTGAEIGSEVHITGNYGPESVDVCADSVERFSAVSHGLGFKSGSSMATADVCGRAAALMSYGKMSPEEVKRAVIETSQIIPGVTGVRIKGGLVQ